jgi:hypothetical protein
MMHRQGIMESSKEAAYPAERGQGSSTSRRLDILRLLCRCKVEIDRFIIDALVVNHRGVMWVPQNLGASGRGPGYDHVYSVP